jgi:hypothetical protein
MKAIGMQEVHLAGIEQVCGRGLTTVRASDGYRLIYCPDLAAVVVTLLSSVARARTGGALIQSVIPWHRVSNSIPERSLLPETEPAPTEPTKAPDVADGLASREQGEVKEEEEATEARRETLTTNRQKRWKGKR